MALLHTPARPCAHTLRVLAHLLRYPDALWCAHGAELSTALQQEAALSRSRRAELDALLQRLGPQPTLQAQAQYVELFDRGRRTALHLFEHVHGDSRERGPAMVDLVQTYEQAGLLLAPDELPDHLPVLLEFASTQPPAQARAFLAEFAHIVRVIFSALLAHPSAYAQAYASVLAAVLELAGQRAEAVVVPAEPALDESWAEPAAFDGCTSAGQTRPAQTTTQVQPIRFVSSPPSSLGVRS